MARKPSHRPTTQHLLGLPEVVLAGASGDPVLESAKGILSTGLGSEVGPGLGSGPGSEFQGRFRFSRSASFNPTMAQLLSISLGAGIGSVIGSDIMISPCMGGVNVGQNKAFHFSDEDLDRDRSRDRGIEDADSTEGHVQAQDERDMTNKECETDAGPEYWEDCGQESSESASFPLGTRDLHGSAHSPPQCSRSQLRGEEDEEEEDDDDEDEEMIEEKVIHRNNNRGRDREMNRERNRDRERDNVLYLTSNETTSTSIESADEDEDNLIGSENFF